MLLSAVIIEMCQVDEPSLQQQRYAVYFIDDFSGGCDGKDRQNY